MTNQNVVVASDRKSSNIGLKITVTLTNSTLFSGADSKALPAPGGGFITISRKNILRKPTDTTDQGGNKINAWVNSLRASSPTRLKSSIALSPQTEEQTSWIARHPSALSKFEEIVNASKGKKIVMFLDYDGTLAPIVEDPDRAFMTNEMREAVRDVARYFPTAIVTGRCRDKVFSFVKLAGLYYAGSHGMDIEGPSKKRRYKKGNHGVLCQPASEFLPMINEVYQTLLEKTKSIPGAKVENNKFCLSVHFRCVDENVLQFRLNPLVQLFLFQFIYKFQRLILSRFGFLFYFDLQSWGSLAEQVRVVLDKYPKLTLTQGRMVLEIRPTIKWDKGKALEFLLEALGYANSKDVVPVYIGDDRTDEDAFKVLRNRGQGFGILVSKTPKETHASYSLQEPSEVKDFLRRLVQWKRLSLRQV